MIQGKKKSMQLHDQNSILSLSLKEGQMRLSVSKDTGRSSIA